MTSGIIGRVEPFQLGVEDWDQYAERLEQYFICNDIADGKKVAVLITVVGADTYGLLNCSREAIQQNVRTADYCNQGPLKA